MLVPLSWLRDFAPFEGDPADLARTFDDLGMVVEGVTRVGEGLDDVVVAKVLAVDAIPKADKIRAVTVDDGSGEPVSVVCGAWNFDAGDTVAFARVGAVLPGGFEIGRRKMRGVESNGMICSTRELELGDDHAGIMVLPSSLDAGTPLREALGLENDVVFDLAIEGNRPDANCITGVARDAAARLGLPFAIPEPAALPVADGVGSAVVVVEAPELCPRFTATVLDGVAIGPSPEWMARRLTLAGMRPISNVVDVSNYVMLELGQPTHPYDLAKLPGGGFLVRAATPGERLETLDGIERVLGNGPHPDCLICDADGTPVGIAGIMGGASSEISDTTTQVALEAAYFDRMAIARTSKRIGLRSEASARFERGVDHAGIERAVARIVELLPGVRTGALHDETSPSSLPSRPRITLRTARVNALLGTELDDGTVRSLLSPIGFEVNPEGDGATSVVAPTFRPDVEAEVDLIEEVARHHGYERVPRTVPDSPHVGGLTPYQRERRFVRDVLCGIGLSEAVGPMLLAPGDHARVGLPEGPGDVVEAEDPLAREESVLRTSLLPGLLRAVAFNAGHRNPDVWLFEIGHVYGPPVPGSGSPLPDERERLAFALAGADADARAAAGVLRSLLSALRLDVTLAQPFSVPGLHPTRTAAIGSPPVGWVGEVDPDVLAAHGIDGRVGWCEVELPALLRLPRRSEEMVPVTRFPSSDVDFAFAVPESVAAGAVEATIRSSGGDLVERVALFDVYRGAGLAVGERSLAFRVRLRALDHTLDDQELAECRRRVISAVETSHSARLRG